jgi:hypothetical protein
MRYRVTPGPPRMNTEDIAGYIKTGLILIMLAVIASGLIYISIYRPERCNAMVPERLSCHGIDADDYCVSLPPCPNKSVSGKLH